MTALLNRQAEAEGLARVNHKRVYRVMKRVGLLLALQTGRAIGLVPCFTSVCSPESNGIAEAFVKTFKRNYVRLNPS